MKTLILMRHGKSSWATASVSDHERPLKPRGTRAARLISEQLTSHGIRPDLIISSDAKRTKDTSKLVVAASSWDIIPVFTRDLYLAAASQYLRMLADHDTKADTVMMIGHNPGLETLVGQLSGKEGSLPTGGTAVFQADIETWSQAPSYDQWRLMHLWLPRELEE